MAWTKQITNTARVSNDRLTAIFEFVQPAGDPPPPRELRFRLLIDVGGATPDVGGVTVDDVLSGAERTQLNSLLVKLRDAALSDAGYVTVS